ncbi:hypothetical protein Slin15195_G013760 [Septoria linicola]|uniref:Uncharacterized protein n=1 Tax=Septoria linicola TaxID=215465 RepID=A0A9Q9AL57_9PEZI|nr:hypothetical protein Slin15195_G013760 [Septoria linicola]
MKQQQQSVHVRGNSFDTLAPSFVTSTCSELSIFSDYGLHRALNAAIKVPNEENPIATIKDRKNANYIEKMANRHDVLKRELDEAIAAFRKVTASRDENEDVRLENMLNRRFLEANNLLARRSRDYSCFLHDIKELHGLPKMSRQELNLRYTVRKANEKANWEDNDAPDVKHQLREVQDQIVDLELEREDLIERTGAVDALAEQVAYVEHLNTSLSREHSRVLERFASKERLCDKHIDAVDQLIEDIAYYEHLNAQKDRANAEVTQDLDNATRVGQMMRRDLEVQRDHAVDLSKQLQNTQNDVRNYQSHLSFAKSTAMQLKDENRTLRREINRLNDQCDRAHDELEDLHAETQRMKVEKERMQEIREMQRETNAHLRREFEEMRGQSIEKTVHFERKTALHRVERSSLYNYAEKVKGELASLRSWVTRRDSVVSSGTEGEMGRSASA